MNPRLTIITLTLFGALAAGGGWAATKTVAKPAAKPTAKPPTAAKVSQQSLNAIELRGQAQELREQHLEREGSLLDQIGSARKELKRVSQHRRKTEAYVNSQRKKLAETRRRIAEVQKIKLELDPLLDRTWNALKEQDALRTPWDKSTAEARMGDIKRILDDYDARPAAKTLAVLNELRHRSREASRIEVSEGEHKIEGRIMRVQLLRLGGLGWYALSMDGKQAWLWNRQADSFASIDDHADQLDRALEIAQRRRVVSLVELPLDSRKDSALPAETKEDRQ